MSRLRTQINGLKKRDQTNFLLIFIYLMVLLFSCNNDSSSEPSNNPPEIPHDPTPDNGAINLERGVTFAWESADADDDSIYYDFYAGADTNPTRIDSGLSTTSYGPIEFNFGTSYFWRVVAYDAEDTSAGSLWTFGVRDHQSAVESIGQFSATGSVSALYKYGTLLLIGDDSVFKIIDVSDPASPSFVGSIATDGVISGIDMSGNYAYVADGYQGGLVIIDIGVPSNPQIMGQVVTTDQALDVKVRGNYAYVASGLGGLIVVNIANPTSPSIVGSLSESVSANSLFLESNYAYLADGDAGLRVVDISSASNPVTAGIYNTPGYAVGVAKNGQYVYVADYESGITIVNAGIPSLPVYAGSYNSSGEAWDIVVSEIGIVLADGAAGIEVLDNSSPILLSYLGSYDAESAISIWVESNLIYVADAANGVLILEYQPE